MDPVATTGLLVAAMRAEESKRPDRLFEDPFAAALAGPEGFGALATWRAATGSPGVPIIEVRTRFFDEALLRAMDGGVRQFVILAAGMDSRAFRLSWPAGARVFEIDQPEVVARKAELLRDVRPTCARVALGVNLAEDWPAKLAASGFDLGVPTFWLVEGLFQYLNEEAVRALLARIDALAAPHSMLLFDVLGRSLLEAPALAPALRVMKEWGAPWRFGTDEPAGLLPAARWNTRSTEPAQVGHRWGRWPFAPMPKGVPGVPRSYFVEGTKR
jgi:methyltransferase (TIGR00027 family)